MDNLITGQKHIYEESNLPGGDSVPFLKQNYQSSNCIKVSKEIDISTFLYVTSRFFIG